MTGHDDATIRLELERATGETGPWVWALYQGQEGKARLLQKSDVTYPSADAAKRIGVQVQRRMLSAVPASDEDPA